MRKWISWFGPGNPVANMDLPKIYPSQEELNEDPEFNRQLAVDMAEDQKAVIAHQREITAALAKWMLTSLLAINAGAMVALAQIKIDGSIKIGAAVFLILGLLMPLISAHLSIRSGLILSLPSGEQQGYWRAVRSNGYRDRELELSHLRIIDTALKLSKWPYRLGYGSIACFVMGVGIAAAGLIA